MDKFKEIRPIVVGLVKKDNKLFGMPGYNKHTNQHYVRLLGGGVEFLETLEVALKREFKEELDAEINIKEFLGFEDNIFVFDGKNAHEHVFLYDIDLLKDFDINEEYVYTEQLEDGIKEQKVVWFDIDDIKSGKLVVFPTIAEKYI